MLVFYLTNLQREKAIAAMMEACLRCHEHHPLKLRSLTRLVALAVIPVTQSCGSGIEAFGSRL